MTGYIDFTMTPIEEAGWVSLMRAGVRVQDGNDHARTRDVWAQALADAGAAVPALVAQVERQRAEMPGVPAVRVVRAPDGDGVLIRHGFAVGWCVRLHPPANVAAHGDISHTTAST